MGKRASRTRSAIFTPSAVWGSITSPYFSFTSRMVAMRSSCVLRPDTKPESSSIFSQAESVEMSKPPFSSTWFHSHATFSPSPPTTSQMKRSKFDAFEMSIEGLEVSCVSAAVRTR